MELLAQNAHEATKIQQRTVLFALQRSVVLHSLRFSLQASASPFR